MYIFLEAKYRSMAPWANKANQKCKQQQTEAEAGAESMINGQSRGCDWGCRNAGEGLGMSGDRTNHGT